MKNPMIDFHTTKILEHLGFRETRDKPGLWYYKQTETDILYVDFRKEDGRRYASISGKMENDGDKFPLLVKVRELREQAKMTGKLPPEVAGAAQGTAKPSEQNQPAPKSQTPVQPAQRPPPTVQKPVSAQPAAPQAEIEYYVPVNIGAGGWTKQPATAEDYRAAEERALAHNLAMLKRCAALVHGESLPVISSEKAVELLYGSVVKHAHYEFERAITKRAMEEMKKVANGKGGGK